jgi:hypothetical protein
VAEWSSSVAFTYPEDEEIRKKTKKKRKKSIPRQRKEMPTRDGEVYLMTSIQLLTGSIGSPP